MSTPRKTDGGRWLLAALLAGCGPAMSAAPTDARAPTDGAPRGADVVAGEDAGDGFGGGSDAGHDDGGAQPDDVADATTPDATTPDAGPPCGIPGALLCEEFESGRIDPARWTVEETNATVAVETGRAAGGRYALHARVQGREHSNGFLHETETFPVAQNRFFGRLMIFFERNLPDRNFIVVEARGPLGGDAGMARYGLGGVNSVSPEPSDTAQRFRIVYHPGDYSKRSTSQPPIDRWACWEWEFDGSTDSIRFWLDGRAMPEVTATASERPRWVAPTFRDLAIGFRVAHADSRAAYDVWIDRVVVATSRVGCPR